MNFMELDTEIKQILSFSRRFLNFDRIELITISSDVRIPQQCPTFRHVELSEDQIQKLKKLKAIIREKDQLSILRDIFQKIDADVIIPLGDGRDCSGVLAIDRGEDLTESEIDTTKVIAGYVSHLIEKYELIEDLKTYSQGMEKLLSELGAIHEISRAFGSGQNLQTLLEFIMEKCMHLMDAEAASLMLLDEAANELEFKVALGPKGKQVKPFRLAVGKGIAGWVAATREPVLIQDAYQDPRFDPSFDKRSGFRTRSILCVPMFYHDKTIGVMQILNRKDGKSFTEEDKMLFTIFATQAALSIENAHLINEAIEKERMEKELEVAAEIQRLLIPVQLPEIPGLDMVASNIPCKQIGGDFYDIRKIDEHRHLITIADVSGKGVPAALVVSTMQASLKAYLQYTNDLVELTGYLNRLIIDQTTSDRYITFFISMYDSNKNELHYVNAGHNPPFLFRKKEVIRLTGGGIPLGFMPFDYEKNIVAMDPEDLILFYTDGLAETMNPAQEEFGEERVVRFFLKQNGSSTKDILSALTETLKTYREGQVLYDDLTMIILKKK